MNDNSCLSGIARAGKWRTSYRLALLGATVLIVQAGFAQMTRAQLCVQLGGRAYKQNFNTMAVSGSSNNSSTIPIGFAFSESGTGNNVTYAASDGSSSTPNTYSYGTGTNTDRAFGQLDGPPTSILGACFVNNTGFVIPSFSVSYTGEQWRLGAADAVQDKLDFQFSTTATSINTGTWTDVNSLDFTSPIPVNSGTAGAVNGNAAANRTVKSPTAIIPPSGIAAGATFFIRWVPTDIAQAEDGLSIDDFQLTYTPSADFNLDGQIDGADLLRLQRGYGMTSGASISQGDANKDGAVDALDMFIFRQQFNPPPFALNADCGCGGHGTPGSVAPEPTGIGVALAAIGVTSFSRRRGVSA